MSCGTYCVACGKYRGSEQHCCKCEKPIYTDTEPTKEQIRELRNRYLAAVDNRPDIERDYADMYETLRDIYADVDPVLRAAMAFRIAYYDYIAASMSNPQKERLKMEMESKRTKLLLEVANSHRCAELAKQQDGE